MEIPKEVGQLRLVDTLNDNKFIRVRDLWDGLPSKQHSLILIFLRHVA